MEKILEYFGVKSKVVTKDDDDIIARFNHFQTVVIFVMFAIIVSTKSFVGEPISCWVPNQFSGSQEDYINNYCWIKNTYYLPTEEPVPKENEHQENVVTYYQWTPLFLLVEALFFYLPYAIWSTFNIKSGIDLNSMIEAGSKLNATEMAEVREKTLKYMTSQMDRYLANIGTHEKMSLTISIKQLLRFGGFLKGGYLYAFFIFIKLLYLINSIAQFLILSTFLGGSFFNYGFQMMSSIIFGITDSIVYQRFPRVTMCDFKIRRLGNIHRYTVQCVLTINHFNEKIFFFIWIWLLVINLANLLSIFIWASRMLRTSSRENYVARHIGYLKNMPDMQKMLEKKNIKYLVDYLKHDGIFILYLLTINADTIAVTDFLENLARNFAKKKRVEANDGRTNEEEVRASNDQVDFNRKKTFKDKFLPHQNKNKTNEVNDAAKYNNNHKKAKEKEAESIRPESKSRCCVLPCFTDKSASV